jgi:hypothetical protein
LVEIVETCSILDVEAFYMPSFKDRSKNEYRMKYFDEEKMGEIRRIFEKEVLQWKGVRSKPMMGCLCYFHNRKFIGFLVTNGIVLMKLSEKDQKEVKEKFGGRPFEMAGKTGRLWVTPLNGPKDVRSVMPFVRQRYEEVSSTREKT